MGRRLGRLQTAGEHAGGDNDHDDYDDHYDCTYEDVTVVVSTLVGAALGARLRAARDGGYGDGELCVDTDDDGREYVDEQA